MAAHVQTTERLTTTSQDALADLRGVIGHLRWRLGLERSAVFAVRGLIGSASLLIALLVAAWLVPIPNWTDAAWIAALPLVAAGIAALMRWPSARQAALAADRRLALEERLTTAFELATRLNAARPLTGRFDRLQVQDAVDRARVTPGTWLSLDRSLRRELLVACLMCALVVAALGLPAWERPGQTVTDQAPDNPDVLAAATSQDPLAIPAPLETTTDAQTLQSSTTDANLASRVQQEQTERAALDSLAQALGQVSAGQPAAEAIQRGDFQAARDQLATLGDEADQLSAAAKQQLGQALQQAASATASTDRQLADRERQAAQALGRTTYADQRQALANLADQVARSGGRSASADQLARDVGQLQQQAAGQRASTAGPAQQPAAEGAGAPGQSPRAAGQGAGGAQQSSAAAGQWSGSTAQQGGPGVGTGSSSDVLGDPQPRLDTTGQRVEVPTKLGAGPGVRPTDGSEDQTGNDPSAGARSVSEVVQSQQTGQVAPEQNLVPGEQRPIVRGYFR